MDDRRDRPRLRGRRIDRPRRLWLRRQPPVRRHFSLQRRRDGGGLFPPPAAGAPRGPLSPILPPPLLGGEGRPLSLSPCPGGLPPPPVGAFTRQPPRFPPCCP